MASTYTPAGIELIADGEQSNTWGQTSNTNFELLEEMITGIVSIALASTSYTLTTTDGATSNGRHAVVVFTGSPGGTCTVTVSPNDMQKVYFIVNNTDQTVTMSQGSGANVSVATGKTKVLYCDGAGAGAAVVDISNGFDATTLADLGITASAAELNILDGVTSTTAELNILDGVTATASELNILDGVTATASELNILDGVTATTAELNILDGVTATTAELNYVDGVTSAIQTQLDNKQPLDADLTALGALAKTDGNFIVGNGTTWVAESGATARTSLGLGALATLSSVNASTIADNSVGADELNVSGDGTSGQFLSSDGDGSFSWATVGFSTLNVGHTSNSTAQVLSSANRYIAWDGSPTPAQGYNLLSLSFTPVKSSGDSIIVVLCQMFSGDTDGNVDSGSVQALFADSTLLSMVTNGNDIEDGTAGQGPKSGTRMMMSVYTGHTAGAAITFKGNVGNLNTSSIPMSVNYVNANPYDVGYGATMTSYLLAVEIAV